MMCEYQIYCVEFCKRGEEGICVCMYVIGCEYDVWKVKVRCLFDIIFIKIKFLFLYFLFICKNKIEYLVNQGFILWMFGGFKFVINLENDFRSLVF